MSSTSDSSERQSGAGSLPAPRPRKISVHAIRLQLGDRIFHGLCLLMALVVPTLTVLLLLVLTRQSLPSLRAFGFEFLLNSEWDAQTGQFGAWAFVCGTLIVSALAMVFAVPLGIGAAVFLAEIAPGSVRRVSTFLVELLAAIPSVVYGFWGIVFLQRFMQPVMKSLGAENTTGKGLFTAGVLLAIMVVPYITAISFDVCRAVPAAQRQAALALGATRWQMIWSVVLPFARPGIVGACFLALGRALGETMAVIMVIGNSFHVPHSLFDLGASIPSVIADQLAGTANPLEKSSLIELGLVLFLVTVLVNCLARLLIWRVGQGGGNSFFRWKRRAQSVATSTVSEDGATFAPASVQPEEPVQRVSTLSNRKALLVSRIMTYILAFCLVIILVPLFHILGYVLFQGASDLNGAFFTNLPIDSHPGLANALVGTGVMVGLASLMAVPVGILAAIYLAEFRNSRLAGVVRFATDLLAGVPSIIIGLFAFVLVVAPFHSRPSAYAGAFALGIMMLPLIIRASEEALKLVPGSLRNASYALGASHWQTVARVVVPAALPAIIASIFLALARIAGETAPLLFTAGNSLFWPHGLDERTPFLTYYIYYGSTLSNDPAYQRLAWSAAVFLLAFVMVRNIGIRLLAGKHVMQASRAE